MAVTGGRSKPTLESNQLQSFAGTRAMGMDEEKVFIVVMRERTARGISGRVQAEPNQGRRGGRVNGPS